MEQAIQKPSPRQSQSPVVTEEVMNLLVARGLVGKPTLSKPRSSPTQGRFVSYSLIERPCKETILAILQETGEPINRMELIEQAIERKLPPTTNPVERYHTTIRKLAREGLTIIDRSQGKEVKDHIISLAEDRGRST